VFREYNRLCEVAHTAFSLQRLERFGFDLEILFPAQLRAAALTPHDHFAQLITRQEKFERLEFLE
jgi:hypothetical protein